MKWNLGFILICCVLAACASRDKTPLVCPQIGVVKHADVLTKFLVGAEKQDDAAIESRAQIDRFSQACRYNKNGFIVVDVDLTLKAALGPASYGKDRPLTLNYPYFVAILDANNEVLTKEILIAEMVFSKNMIEAEFKDPLRQKIPVDSPDQGMNYKILIGLQLTEDELAYNKKVIY